MKVAEYIEKCKKDIGWDSDAEQEWQKILHAVAFQERCAKDGILTYDRECNELRYLVKSMDLQYIIDDIFCMQEQVEAPNRLKQARKLEELKELLEKKK